MTADHKTFALKRIRLSGCEKDAVSGFEDEIRLLGNLKGLSNIIQLVDFEVRFDCESGGGEKLTPRMCGSYKVISRTHVPRSLPAYISLHTKPVSILSAPIQTIP